MSESRHDGMGVGVLSGSVFAVGLALSGMTDPQKVLAFLDVFGAWDPSLAFVMLGAIGVHFSWLRSSARHAPAVSPPGAIVRGIDRPLLLGAAIFGLGWGLSGYCPGPALVALAFGRPEAALFVAAMLVGMLLFQLLSARITAAQSGEPP